jgi:hypothetical protein
MGGGSEGQSNKFEPPEWTAERFPGAMDTLDQLASTPYQQFQGMRVAPLTDYQHTAGQLTADRALNGDPQSNAARGSLMSISQGGGMNPFMDNAFTEEMIGNTAQNMAQGFATGTQANTSAAAARSGAFGGSAHNELATQQAAGLAQQIGNMATQTRQADIGRKGGLWNQDIGNILQASSMAPAFSAQDQSAFDSLNRYGGQQQNYTQALLNEQVGEFNRQQAHPFNMLDWYLGGLAKGSGQYGTNYQQQGGGSPLGQAAGGAAALYGLFGS